MPGLAEDYDAWYTARARSAGDPREIKICEWILDLLEVRSGRSLLDVACGTGTFLQQAARRGLRVSGVDLSQVALDHAKARVPHADLRKARGEELPFGETTFDYVTCIGSLEHFPDPEGGAREIARVLKPDGRAIVYVPNLFFLGHVWLGLRHGTQPSEGNQQFSERFLSSGGWCQLLGDAGLCVESWQPWNHVWATEKVSRATIAVWNAISRVIPRNGSYAFAFVCSRA
jgi:SAM-dependent methyltransferase